MEALQSAETLILDSNLILDLEDIPADRAADRIKDMCEKL